MVIQHNMSALNTNRQYKISSGELASSTEKLSSGYKINRSADDAAGLSISEKMRKQIRGLDRGAINIEDGISYAQVADGALNEVHDMLQRINELAVQSANGTNSASDRANINDEVQLLKAEMERVFTTTTFNERQIWKGDNPLDQKEIIGVKNVQSATINQTSYINIDVNNENYEYLPNDLYKICATEDDGVSVQWRAYNGITYTTKSIDWDTFRENNYTITAKDLLEEVTYTDPADGSVKTEKLYDSAGKPMFEFQVKCAAQPTATTAQLATALNNVPIYRSPDAYWKGESSYLASKGITISSNMSFSAAVYDRIEAQKNGKEGYDFMQESTTDVEPDLLNGISNFQNNNGLYEFHFNMEGLGPVTAKFNYASISCPSDISNLLSPYREYGGYTNTLPPTTGGSKVAEYYNEWWSYSTYNPPYHASDGNTYKYYLNTHGDTKYANDHNNNTEDAVSAILTDADTGLLAQGNGGNSLSGGTMTFQFNVTSDQKFNHYPGTDTNPTSVNVGTIYFNISVDKTDTEASVLAKLQDAFNTQHTVLDMTTRNHKPGYDYHAGTQNNSPTQVYDYAVTSYYDDIDLNIHSGSETTDKINMDYECLRLSSLGMFGTNVLTQEDALAAIDEVSKALEVVSSQRSLFGSYQNRMEHAYNIDQNSSENSQYAESQIRDTDMAKEMVNYSNLNILGQAGQSMLAQSNQKNQGILNLIG